ncbi:patatin-like phospholipase family protein [Mycolicibacterium neworleansense]|uniref:Phospholipase n=1 Tax=Mycolicibacterium neworleansense TaxID=146018 RepID=A0A0H5RJL3_9MYCO|nr:patatin-like phospholipase family protein [Mycolicibacterium neworleansense]MCV7361894.1 patatin-like phospholipase family protein [Mycolicibacterium neworleansense]CRZ13702.1 phospholipase [Mycolicibacterium neworleansense]
MTTALVIGCGGTIGGAWTVAALHALAEQTGWDPREAAIMQGTSAGAELITMLGGGATVSDLVAMQRGTSADERLRRHVADTPAGLPPVPAPRLLNPRLLGSQRGLAAATGIAPVGRANPDWLQRLADGFSGASGWLPHAGVRMVAFDYQRGERVAFGAPGAPVATVGEALRASWAVPGWMPPVTIGGRHFVDGGAASTASVDLIGRDEADVIYVITPMASEPGMRAPGFGGRLEHALLRRPMSAGLDREVAAVRARGTQVVVIRPDAADLAGLGSHFMRRGRRRSAFEASMRTAPATVRRALVVGEEAR